MAPKLPQAISIFMMTGATPKTPQSGDDMRELSSGFLSSEISSLGMSRSMSTASRTDQASTSDMCPRTSNGSGKELAGNMMATLSSNSNGKKQSTADGMMALLSSNSNGKKQSTADGMMAMLSSNSNGKKQSTADGMMAMRSSNSNGKKQSTSDVMMAMRSSNSSGKKQRMVSPSDSVPMVAPSSGSDDPFELRKQNLKQAGVVAGGEGAPALELLRRGLQDGIDNRQQNKADPLPQQDSQGAQLMQEMISSLAFPDGETARAADSPAPALDSESAAGGPARSEKRRGQQGEQQQRTGPRPPRGQQLGQDGGHVVQLEGCSVRPTCCLQAAWRSADIPGRKHGGQRIKMSL